jgi:hypothetical protein
LCASAPPLGEETLDEEGSDLSANGNDADDGGFEEVEDFLVWRAEENIPSGTTRSRRKGIESIVLRLPSVDLVK